MNKINVPSPSNGIRLYWDDLNYLLGFGSFDSGVYNALVGILKAWGNNYIVQGCTDLGSNVVSAGWVMLDGELLKVDQHTSTDSYFEKITETNSTGDRDDSLGNSVNIYQQLRATATAATGNLTKTGVRPIDFAATDARAGKIRIATQAEANALSLEDVAVTPGRIPISSLTQKGVIERATASEVNNRTDNERAITPSTLNGSIFHSIRPNRQTFNAVGGNVDEDAGLILITGNFSSNTDITLTNSDSGAPLVHIFDIDINLSTATLRVIDSAGNIIYSESTNGDHTLSFAVIRYFDGGTLAFKIDATKITATV